MTENSYRTIHSMTFVLPNGFTLDTCLPDADRIFEDEQSHIAKRLLELKSRIIHSRTPYNGGTLAKKIQRRYQMKNNNGYLLNAFLDFKSPLDILTHLLIGSEGTLGFIAEAVLHTLPDYTYKYTGQPADAFVVQDVVGILQWVSGAIVNTSCVIQSLTSSCFIYRPSSDKLIA